ncbi:HNH endonuclease signature motif containing protein [Fodinicola acaciae]|uniref:HNH endonuclease signature motif containing protein n=1 Tax=Fodinicola acaciae TaxID=2681555 RepID=UPI0013D7FC5A|nr:HNH endonuclease signature motif containing protein [Fodinicola acaciae]
MQEILSPLAKPRTDDKGKTKDLRSAVQRNGDALAEALNLIADSEKLPIQGRERPHLTITLSWEMLRDKLGQVRAYENTVLSTEAARRLACDATSLRWCSARKAKRWMLTVRGCAMIGCTRPVRWTRAHHVIHWADGGKTSIDNCVLLCEADHRQIHHGDWQVRMVDGIPEFIPPRYVDIEQKPLRNTYHLLN